MPRPKSPDGAWVTVPVRLRQSDLERVDAARGEKNRSGWMRDAARVVLGVQPLNSVLPIPVVADDLMPLGTAALVTPGQPPQVVTEIGPAPAKATGAPKRSPRPAARTTRPRSAPTATELANERQRDARVGGKPAVTVPEPPVAGCGHTYPDVRNVAGVRVCRKCD